MESKIMDTFARPLTVGVLAGLAAKAMGDSTNFTANLLGYNVSGPVFYAILGTGSSLAAETLRNWILPYIPANNAQMVQLETALLAPALNAGVNVAVMSLLFKDVLKGEGMLQPILIGAGAEVAGDYAYNQIIVPFMMR